MTDTRPTLTARWRALERKGWVFRVGEIRVGNLDGDLWTHAFLESYHPELWVYPDPHITIPMSVYTEIEALRLYENAVLRERPDTH